MPLIRKRRTSFITFRSMVVNHVKNDFQARVMEMSDHLFELRNRPGCEVARIRREETDRVVGPIVSQPPVE